MPRGTFELWTIVYRLFVAVDKLMLLLWDLTRFEGDKRVVSLTWIYILLYINLLKTSIRRHVCWITSLYVFRCHEVFAHKRFIERDSRSAFRDYAKAVNKLFERVITRNEREVAIAPLARKVSRRVSRSNILETRSKKMYTFRCTVLLFSFFLFSCYIYFYFIYFLFINFAGIKLQ
jgi:hypothetical protein